MPTDKSSKSAFNRQSGFTLVEVLVSIVISAIAMSLAISGLQQCLRVAKSIYEEPIYQPLEVIQKISKLLSQTMAATEVDEQSGIGHLLFEGDEHSIEFATLSDGFAIPGGLITIRLVFGPDDSGKSNARIYYAPFRPIADQTRLDGPWPLSDRITEMSFRYYGAQTEGERADWYNEWHSPNIRPYAVEVRLALKVKGEIRTLSLISRLRTEQNRH